ncbi:hypothetical protein [Actinomadura sp. 9N407]
MGLEVTITTFGYLHPAGALGKQLYGQGIQVVVEHRDLDRAVVER